MKHRTEYLRRALAEAGLPMDRPLEWGTMALFFEGTATGNGRRIAGTPIPGPAVNLGGMVPHKIEYRERGWLHHEITDGVISKPLYWHGVAGGWIEIQVRQDAPLPEPTLVDLTD